MFSHRVGVDLGTSRVRAYVHGRGIVLDEPSVVALSAVDDRVVAIGQHARDMEERSSTRLELVYPIRRGVIADYELAAFLLRQVLRRAVGRFALARPSVMLAVPAGVTSVESHAALDAALWAGAREVHLIPAPLAAAIGAGLPLASPAGNMIVSLGAGTCEAAVLSLNDIVVSSSSRVGGDRIDERIVTWLRQRHHLLIGRPTAEDTKLRLASAIPQSDDVTLDVRGLDQASGLPGTTAVSSWEVTAAIGEMTAAILATVRSVLEQTPPELVTDVADKGMILTGGGSLLRNLDKLLTRETGIPAFLADDPTACTVVGAGRALENYAVFRESLLHAWSG